MSDRLAVMDNGRVEQVGTPDEVYEEPRTAYVADFLGVANLLDADCTRPGGEGTIRLGAFSLAAHGGRPGLHRRREGGHPPGAGPCHRGRGPG